MYWMITDRGVEGDRLGGDHEALSYWCSESERVDRLSSWRKLSEKEFLRRLFEELDRFPAHPRPEDNELQKHLTLFVHGYNNDWEDAARRYRGICKDLFAPGTGLGICVLFTWPSDGMVTNYLPDRADARKAAPDLADVLSNAFDWLQRRQQAGNLDPTKACRAKTSVIAHSMGNYVLQHAMHQVWTRKSRPLLVSLVNQLVMVAADVDNDLFAAGESIEQSEGEGIANLTYRITVLYSGLDSVLGLSAGLKHFGKRRMGRSGLDLEAPRPDNVWQVDCSSLFSKRAASHHSAYFESPKTLALIRRALEGSDRGVIESELRLPG